ncbi:uncharacterized protein PpBr36_10045 [Pyricularia pennisetigena]|uniref:uncharacterized protein n=1 Tax=Pyricularia pennisetigena TaxID=1578925 RepID=UPI00114DD984|nr:uncharacterized protein PpBr36_10045 [Pyricularia pennisetigena]TLS22478.1 hypothetical protein PpBr36_10045 [Pyricularia pennisetigena]
MRSESTLFAFALIATHLDVTAAKGCPYSIRQREGWKEVKWGVIEAGDHITIPIRGYAVKISADKNCDLSQKGLPRHEYTIVRGDTSPPPPQSCTITRRGTAYGRGCRMLEG